MQTTQYKVIYLDENQERRACTCLDLAAVGRCQTTLFRILSVIPQLVVDQLSNSDALIKQARLDYSLSQRNSRVKAFTLKLEILEQQAKALRSKISIESMKVIK